MYIYIYMCIYFGIREQNSASLQHIHIVFLDFVIFFTNA